MQDTDAVSCLLCLQADEYGSMIKVCVPPGRIPPSSEKVICRLCAGIVAAVLDGQEGEQIGRAAELRTPAADDVRGGASGGDAGVSDWDSDLPERGSESVVEVDRSEPENATGSSKAGSTGRVTSGKTDD